MECREVIQHLGSYLDGEQCPELRQHLATCLSCRQLARSCQTTVRVYRAQPVPTLPAGVHRRLMDHMGRRVPPKQRSPHRTH